MPFHSLCLGGGFCSHWRNESSNCPVRVALKAMLARMSGSGGTCGPNIVPAPNGPTSPRFSSQRRYRRTL